MRFPRLTPHVFALVCALAVPGSRPSVDRGETEAEIRAFFESLQQAYHEGSLPRVRSHYGGTDARFLEMQTHTASGFLAGLEDAMEEYGAASFALRVVRVDRRGPDAEVLLLRRAVDPDGWWDGDTVDWLRCRLRATPAGWTIVAEEELSYVRPTRTDLDLTLHPEQGLLEASARLALTSKLDGIDVLVFGLNEGLREIRIVDDRGVSLPFERFGRLVVLPLGEPLEAGEGVRIRFTYRGGGSGSFFHLDPEGCAVSFVASWYPGVWCEQAKTVGTVSYTVPRGWIVASSGRRAEESTTGDVTRFVFAVRSPMNLAFAAAPYVRVERDVDGIRYGAYLLDGGEAKARRLLDPAIAMIRHLSDRDVFGMYPYDGYAIVEVPVAALSGAGAYSDQGLTVFPRGWLREEFVDLANLSHEIGHCWWGNWVVGNGTLMSEGLAQMTSLLCLEQLWGPELMRKYMRSGVWEAFQAAYLYFVDLAGDRDKPLYGVPPSGEGMHALACSKGHFVFLMLRDEIGESAFCEGLRHALDRYADRFMTLQELQGEWEAASRRDLDWFFDQWFARPGAPEFRLDASWDRPDPASGESVVRGAVLQTSPPYRAALEIRVEGPDRSISHLVTVEGERTPFELHVPFLPDRVTLDPDERVFRWTEEYRAMRSWEEGMRRYVDLAAWTATGDGATEGEKEPSFLLARCWGALRRYVDLGDDDGALVQFEYLLENADPRGDVELYLPLICLYAGHVHDVRGRRTRAMECYRNVLSLDRTGRYHALAERYLREPYAP